MEAILKYQSQHDIKPLIDRTKLFVLSNMNKLNKNITFEKALDLSDKISKKYNL